MDSYIGRLQAAIEVQPDPDARSELEAKLGCYHARTGDAEQAKAILASLRSSGAFVGSPRVAIRGMLLESLVAFFEDLDPGGSDRALRANALAVAGNFVDLVDLTSAWLAHYYFNADDVARCVRYLSAVLDHPTLDPEARLRAILVFADLNMYCGRVARSRVLYEQARQLAVDIRDQASIAAMLYNKAALAMNWIRVSRAAAMEDDLDGALGFLYNEIDSSEAYHSGARQRSLSQLRAWAIARRELDRGHLASASDMYRKLVDAGLPQSTTSATLGVRVEYAECLLALGDKPEAAMVISSIGDEVAARVSFDDELLLNLLKLKANAVLGTESPFKSSVTDESYARQRFVKLLGEVRLAADRVEAAWEAGAN